MHSWSQSCIKRKILLSFYALSSTYRLSDTRSCQKDKLFDFDRYFLFPSKRIYLYIARPHKHSKGNTKKNPIDGTAHLLSKGKDNISFCIVYLFLPIGYVSPAGFRSTRTFCSVSIAYHTVNVNFMAHFYALKQ